MSKRAAKPWPEVGQWWRFGKVEGRVAKLYSGGGGDMGGCSFDGYDIPPAHVTTMMHFDAWTYLPNGPTAQSLPPPCSCITLDGGVVLSDGCPAHDATHTISATAESVPALQERSQ